MDVVLVEIVGLVVALVVAGFCSGARRAFEDVDFAADESVGQREGRRDSEHRAFAWWDERRGAVAIVLALANRLAIVTAVVSALLLVGNFFEMSRAEVVGVIASLTVLIVVVADLVPTVIARRMPRTFALAALRVLRLPYLVLYPLTQLLLLFRRLVVAIVGTPADHEHGQRSKTRQILHQLMNGGESSAMSRRLLMRSVVEFPATIVREVMVPRTDMVTLSMDMELEEILVVLLECGHSRIPVYGDSLDDIRGLFYAKDVIQLMASGKDFEIEALLRPPYFVLETKPISELLTEFQRERIHLAVVVDEFGGTAGLITLEDIIEEFFGDIQDEYDVEPSQLIELSPTTVLADARIGIDEIEEFFDITLPNDGDYDSLGGFLLAHTGSVPAVGDEIEWESLLFRIMEADLKRIDTVEIVSRSGEPDDEPRAVS